MNMRLKTGEPKSVSSASFFNEICPQILTDQKAACAKLGGVYGIQLLGETGGSWTLYFDNATVENGIPENVDFLMQMESSDFEAMMKGKFDVSTAPDKIRFEGKPEMFNNLAIVLRPLN